MRRCIRLVRIAKERGESPVGVVVMRHGEVIAEDIEATKARQDITRHAEVEARWSPDLSLEGRAQQSRPIHLREHAVLANKPLAGRNTNSQ